MLHCGLRGENDGYGIVRPCLTVVKRLAWSSPIRFSDAVASDRSFDTPPPYVPVDEECARPESAYSLSKLLSEEMAKQFCWDPEMKIIGLRFSNVMEPHSSNGRLPGICGTAPLSPCATTNDLATTTGWAIPRRASLDTFFVPRLPPESQNAASNNIAIFSVFGTARTIMTIIGHLSTLSLLAFSLTCHNMVTVRLLSLRLGRLVSYPVSAPTHFLLTFWPSTGVL